MKLLAFSLTATLLPFFISLSASGTECFPGTSRFLDEASVSPVSCEGDLPVQSFRPRYQLCGANGTYDGIIFGNIYQKVIGQCCNGATLDKTVSITTELCKYVEKHEIQTCVNFSWQSNGDGYKRIIGDAPCKASPSSPDDCPCP